MSGMLMSVMIEIVARARQDLERVEAALGLGDRERARRLSSAAVTKPRMVAESSTTSTR